MNRAEKAGHDIRAVDDLAAGGSFMHKLHPLAKLTVTMAYIITVISFNKYDLAALSGMVLFPFVFYSLAGITISTCFSKLRYVLPLVCAVGLFNPFFDRAVYTTIGTVNITGGVISMLTLMFKGVLCLTASFLLAATTPIEAICKALRLIRMPRDAVILLLLTWRYITVLLDEVAVMTDSYSLRAPGEKGVRFSAWGTFLGQLLLRSRDKAENLYESMLMRGFDGDFRYSDGNTRVGAGIIFAVVSVSLFIVFRFFNIPVLFGRIITEAFTK